MSYVRKEEEEEYNIHDVIVHEYEDGMLDGNSCVFI